MTLRLRRRRRPERLFRRHDVRYRTRTDTSCVDTPATPHTVTRERTHARALEHAHTRESTKHARGRRTVDPDDARERSERAHMMTTRTTGGAAARVSAWRTRGGERRARVVARMTTGENVSEPVEKNGCDVRRGRALESGSNGNEDRGARTDDKRQSRWSSEFWDELEFDVMEPWMMQEDDTRGDGFLRSESLLSPSWRLMLLSDGSVTVRVRV